ncbi:MAG: chromate resistance protein ChrB domain-containing protein [Acidobacteriota bacterium]
MHHGSFASASARAWLVLLYQVPGRSSSVRVRVWRRLQSIGAVQIRQSAYVLPNRDQPREDLEWLRAEIIGLGGEATVLLADALDPLATEEIVEGFRSARGRDVSALTTRGTRWLRKAAKRDRDGAPLPAPLAREARALLEDWRSLSAITYFEAPGVGEMEAIVQQISQLTNGRGRRRPTEAAHALDRSAFAGRRWVTRPRPGVDRMASAWLIRRYIDPRATFEFSSEPVEGAVAFDMYGVEFGHQGDACSCEVLADRFGIDDPAVRWIARMVHDLDLRESRFNEAEAPGLMLMIEGLRRAHPDDRELLERGIALFESMALAFPGKDASAQPAAAVPAGKRRKPKAGRMSKRLRST